MKNVLVNVATNAGCTEGGRRKLGGPGGKVLGGVAGEEIYEMFCCAMRESTFLDQPLKKNVKFEKKSHSPMDLHRNTSNFVRRFQHMEKLL